MAIVNDLYTSVSPITSPKGDDLIRPFVPTVAVPFYDVWWAEENAFGYAISKNVYNEATPASERGVNPSPMLLELCRFMNELGGGTETTGASIKKDGRVDTLKKPLFEWNPSNIEHVLTYYTGGVGKLISNSAKTAANISRAISTKDLGEIKVYQIPIFRRFYGTFSDTNYRSKFFELSDRMSNQSTRVKDLSNGAEKTNLQNQIKSFKTYNKKIRKLWDKQKEIEARYGIGSSQYKKMDEQIEDLTKRCIIANEKYDK